jgi:hypothetical protein
MRKFLSVLIAAAAFGSLAGCAGPQQLANDVSSYSIWPADRKPGTYAFERLPSQQLNEPQQQLLEEAAHRALEQAGFTPAADPKAADYSVTLGARVTAYQLSPFDDPFWWHGGLWGYRHYWRPYTFRPFGPPRFGPPFYDSTTYEREVAMLIRDKRSGQPLYEVRVTNDGYNASINTLLPAMFEAGMKDFPHGGANPRRVVTQVAG